MKKILFTFLLSFSLVLFLGLGKAYAADFEIGNETITRPNVDTYSNFVIVDTNDYSVVDGYVRDFNYWAANSNSFKFLIVDDSKIVKWKSDLITPNGTIPGVNTYTPSTSPIIEKGWYIGLYFQNTGTIPFTYDSVAEYAYYTPNHWGEPAIGSSIVTAGTTQRFYSFYANVDVIRYGEITNPDVDEIVNGTVVFQAYLIDNDEDLVQWAVRKGTCAAGTGTVWGNVDYHNNPFTWELLAPYTRFFNSSANVETWLEGKYCFVFNPTEDGGESEIRLTREFYVETDEDNDGVLNIVDNCQSTYNPDQEDWNNNYIGDVCDDSDSDLIMDNLDNCVNTPNTDQLNHDTDEWGDMCDDDDDNDGFLDGGDNCPLVSNDQADLDGDGDGDVCDDDIDGDGVLNSVDKCDDTSADILFGQLGVNRWRVEGTSGLLLWNTRLPNGNGPNHFNVTLTDTYGCSCTQILDAIHTATAEELQGHYAYGCSKSILEDWMAGLYYVGPILIDTITVKSDESIASTTKTISPEKTYILRASGTYTFATWAGDPLADAKCSYGGASDPLSRLVWTSGDILPVPYRNYLEIRVNNNIVDWGVPSGECNDTDHEYEMEITGVNHFDFNIYDGGAIFDNSGDLTVEIFEDKWVNLW